MQSGHTILLRSSWQTVNIGDIAHTPGMLALIEKHLPGSRVILWYSAVHRGVAAMLRKRFPTLRFVPAGVANQSGPADLSPEQAMAEADLLLHGSGPALAGANEVRQWVEQTRKPWGAIGVTLQAPTEQTAALLSTATFLFTRETHSIDHVKNAGVATAATFAPDATFACEVRDDASADAFLREAGLAGEKFICVIPRLRRTPYYRIHPSDLWTPARITELDAHNARHVEADHAKLREVIIRYVRSTGRRVLLCSEMEYQVALQRPLLLDPLPADVKRNVISRNRYWLTDEATSVHRHAEALIGCECHSPILCAANGVTGFYVRQPEDTIKGQMYYDLGLSDRIAEIEQTDGPALADRFMKLIDNPPAAQQTLAEAMTKARGLLADAMNAVRNVCEATQ